MTDLFMRYFDKLGQYFSALSNEARLKRQEAGWLILGVQNNPRKIVGSDFRRNRANLDNLKKEIADQTSNRLTFIEIHELYLPEGRVVMFEIPPARPGQPTAWKGIIMAETVNPLARSIPTNMSLSVYLLNRIGLAKYVRRLA